MNAISPLSFLGALGGCSPFGGGSPFSPASSSPWGADALELTLLELAPLLEQLEKSGATPNSPQFPGSFPGQCESGSAASPAAMPGTIPGSGNCCGCCDSTPSGSLPPSANMMPSVQWQGNQPASSHHTYTTSVGPNGDVNQNVTFSGATGSQLSDIQNSYDPSTGVEHSVETAANGHHAYVTTYVQGNSDISLVSGDQDVTGGATKFVVSMNGDKENCTEYHGDGTTRQWVDTSNSGQTYSPWSTVASGVTNDSETSVSTGNGWSASYNPDSGSDYTATYV